MTEYVDVRLADAKFLQELQELQNDPPTCPTCGKSSVTVYCTPLSDTEVRLLLRATGRSAYAGPCHRVNIGVDSPDETV